MRDSCSYQRSEPKEREQAREKGRVSGGRSVLYLKSERVYMYVNERERMCSGLERDPQAGDVTSERREIESM